MQEPRRPLIALLSIAMLASPVLLSGATARDGPEERPADGEAAPAFPLTYGKVTKDAVVMCGIMPRPTMPWPTPVEPASVPGNVTLPAPITKDLLPERLPDLVEATSPPTLPLPLDEIGPLRTDPREHEVLPDAEEVPVPGPVVAGILDETNTEVPASPADLPEPLPLPALPADVGGIL